VDTLFVGLRVVVSLGAVLALLWVIQRKVSKSGTVAKKAKHIQVVARQGIAGKASVAVVDVDGARYVLGVTEQSVNVLSVGETPQEARVTALAPVAPVAVPVAPSAPVFAQTLAAEQSPRRAARAAAAAAPVTSPVAGSILSASTWKMAAAAMRQQRRA
jgi:flagellar protein FliO/FliZ